MKNQSDIDHDGVRVRPLEPRDLAYALNTFPAATKHLQPVLSVGCAQSTFVQEIFSGRQCAWVAEAQKQLIGMVVLSTESQMLARLTYLNVAGEGPHQAIGASALAEVAIRSAWDAGYLKLAVHTHIPASHTIAYMHRLGFEFSRTRWSGGELVIEFYRNLYEPPRVFPPDVADSRFVHEALQCQQHVSI